MLKGRLVPMAAPAHKVRLDLRVQRERRARPVLMVRQAPPALRVSLVPMVRQVPLALRVRLVLMALPVRPARRV
ncbi:MAG TPA: hypothetical protein VKH19_13265 [Gemmatimonadaceae bacterium]|nr:hypothetical protein [Gemmatimonadaceae bacterium]